MFAKNHRKGRRSERKPITDKLLNYEELLSRNKKWLESINQREVKWFISENALKEWEVTDDNK